MCRAIIGGMLKAGITKPGDILVSDKNPSGLEALKAEYGIEITDENCNSFFRRYFDSGGKAECVSSGNCRDQRSGPQRKRRRINCGWIIPLF